MQTITSKAQLTTIIENAGLILTLNRLTGYNCFNTIEVSFNHYIAMVVWESFESYNKTKILLAQYKNLSIQLQTRTKSSHQI